MMQGFLSCAIEKNLQIMDTAAFALCREHSLDICVFSMLENTNTLSDILDGKPSGTILSVRESSALILATCEIGTIEP
jgi:uridylate kinase